MQLCIPIWAWYCFKISAFYKIEIQWTSSVENQGNLAKTRRSESLFDRCDRHYPRWTELDWLFAEVNWTELNWTFAELSWIHGRKQLISVICLIVYKGWSALFRNTHGILSRSWRILLLIDFVYGLLSVLKHVDFVSLFKSRRLAWKKLVIFLCLHLSGLLLLRLCHFFIQSTAYHF